MLSGPFPGAPGRTSPEKVPPGSTGDGRQAAVPGTLRQAAARNLRPGSPFVPREAAGVPSRPSPHPRRRARFPRSSSGESPASRPGQKSSHPTQGCGMAHGRRLAFARRITFASLPARRCGVGGPTGGAVDPPGLWTPGRRRRRIRGTSASWPARVCHGRSAFAADGNASRCQRRAVRSLSPNRQRLPTILFSRNRRTCASVTNPSSRRETGNLTRLPPGPSNRPPISPSPTGHNNLFDQLVGDRIQFSTIPSATSRNLFFFPSSSSSLNFSRCSLIALSNSPRTFFPAGAF